LDLKEEAASTGHRHPWELARGEGILALLPPGAGRAADIGAGDMYFSGLLAGRGWAVTAADANYAAGGQEGPIIKVKDLSGLKPGSQDLVLLMDVLEHVPDERALLAEALGVLRPGGTLLATVPAHRWLFSPFDAFMGHLRRYGKGDLRGLLAGEGLEIRELFFFFLAPYLARAAQVLLGRLGAAPRQGHLGCWSYGADHPFTLAAAALLKADFLACRLLSKCGLGPAGLSLCAVCVKK
jgi:SAM-dependent methyltransferase